MTLTPSYGRDYKSKKAVLEDFEADKDFTIASIGPYCGKQANRTNLLGEVNNVTIRYNKMRSAIVVKL